MKNLPFTAALCAAGLGVAIALFFLSQEKTGPAEVDSHRIIALPDRRMEAVPVAGATADRAALIAAAGRNGRADDRGDDALEAIAARIEKRLTHLEEEMTQASLLPLSNAQLESELERQRANFTRAQEKADAQYTEVCRLAKLLAVPPAVRERSAWEALKDPACHAWRTYFEAKLEASGSQDDANVIADRLLDLEARTS